MRPTTPPTKQLVPAAQRILDIVVEMTGVSADDIFSESRHIKHCEARQIAWMLLQSHLDMSTADLCSAFGRKKSAISHGTIKVWRLVGENSEATELVRKIRAAIVQQEANAA